MRSTLLAFLMLVWSGSAGVATAQSKGETLGPNECLNCHDHDSERQWYEKKEIPEVRRLFPDRDAKAGHINSLNQLESPKSDAFAKAIGLADKYDATGACVACHGTVYRGEANSGVSCESCHGPGGRYLKPHQTKGSYEVSVAQYGMTRLIGNIQGWTQQCTNCHVMDDERLIKAGHPSGDDFDLSRKYVPVSLHFKKSYSEADVAAVAGPQMAAVIRLRRSGLAGAAASAPPAPQPVAPTATAPAATVASASTVEPQAVPATTAPTSPAVAAEPANPTSAPSTRAPLRTAVKPAVPSPSKSSWSPTSIEPRVPIEAATPETTAAVSAPEPVAPAPTVEPLPPAAEPIETSTLLLIGLAVVAVGGLLFWFIGRRSKR